MDKSKRFHPLRVTVGGLGALLVVTSAVQVGCARPQSAHNNSVSLRIGVASPRTGVPTHGIATIAGNLVAEPLVSMGWDGRPASKLAATWQILENGRKVRLELDPTVRFHDGTPLTASIARDALLERLQDPGAQVSAISYLNVEKVEAIGAHSLEVALKKPDAFFIPDLALSAINHPHNPALGTGPFKREESASPEQSATDVIKLTAFDSYYRGRPRIQYIEFRRYDEQRSAWAALLRDEIDAVHEITPGSIDFVKRDSSIAMFQSVRPYFMLLGFNVKHPVLGNKAVRQALNQAINREELIKVALNGQGVVADGPIWPSHWAYSRAKTYPYNPEAAMLRLEAAGLRMPARRNPGFMPSRLRFTCLTVPDSRYEKLAMMLQKQLYEVGVDMQIEVVPLRLLGQRIASGNFEAFLAERTSGRSLNWTYVTFHSRYRIIPGYSAADSVLERLREAMDENEMRAAVVELQRVLHDDPPAAFLVWPQIARAVSTRFTVPSEGGRDVLGSIWQWRPAAQQ